MRIYLFEREDKQFGIGGGPTFLRNFKEVSTQMGHEIVKESWDVALACGATMVQREDWEKAKKKGPVVLRVDGIPEDWRNRGTGWPRLKDYARDADVVIYQSCFVRNTVGRLLGRDGAVIYNGVNKSVFKPAGPKFPRFGNPSILHINYRKDPNKRWDEVIVRFREFKINNPGATITFVGNYPREIVEYEFGMLDWERNKDWQHLGAISDREELAKVMRSADLFAWPSFADPCPNTLIEAMACGCKPLWINNYGGQREIVDNWDLIDWSRERMVREYLEVLENVIK